MLRHTIQIGIKCKLITTKIDFTNRIGYSIVLYIIIGKKNCKDLYKKLSKKIKIFSILNPLLTYSIKLLHNLANTAVKCLYYFF